MTSRSIPAATAPTLFALAVVLPAGCGKGALGPFPSLNQRPVVVLTTAPAPARPFAPTPAVPVRAARAVGRPPDRE